MPIRDELITRILRQLADALARLTRLGQTVQADELDPAAIAAELDDVYRRFMGTSRALVARLSTDDLLSVIGSAGHVDGERAYLLAALLEVEAALDAVAGSDPVPKRERALDLLLEAAIAELGEPDLPERVDRLLAGSESGDRSEGTWERLLEYRSLRSELSAAEDALFAWGAAVTRDRGDPVRIARAAGRFYAALEQMDDDLLDRGGLPRGELEEGRRDLGRLVGTDL